MGERARCTFDGSWLPQPLEVIASDGHPCVYVYFCRRCLHVHWSIPALERHGTTSTWPGAREVVTALMVEHYPATAASWTGAEKATVDFLFGFWFPKTAVWPKVPTSAGVVSN